MSNLKDQLIKEAQTIETKIELDSIFESFDLTDTVKENFTTVFETAVKKQALALAESHIQAIAEKAEKDVEEKSTEKTEEKDKKFNEKADKFFAHLAETWLEDNVVEIDKGIKSQMFESMFIGLKDLFIEHNVTLPAESVDVVAEMEEELAESKLETQTIFEKHALLKEEFQAMKREKIVESKTSELTESQKEKVLGLIEGLEYGDAFESKVQSIVEFATSKPTIAEKPLVENTDHQTDDPAALNYKVEPAVVTESEDEDPLMAQFLAAANSY